MKSKRKLFFYIFIVFLILLPVVLASNSTLIPAPDFTTSDIQGNSFSLSDYKGNVIILHFTQIEEPVCMECLKEMKGQIVELKKLYDNEVNVTIITINIRKNPYSITGKEMVERDFGVNVTWHWVEDFEPFPISSLYRKYWTVDGAFSNPTILIVDKNQIIAGLYHIYCMGKGPIDGIQDAGSLSEYVEKITEGKWDYFEEEIKDDSITFFGMFILGILTSISPCSIALLVAMISYVGSLNHGVANNKKISTQGIWIGLTFTLGMSIVFFIFGLMISSIGVFIESSQLFYLIAGIILIILGINVFIPLKDILKIGRKEEVESKLMEKGKDVFFRISRRSVYFGAFFLGILFSIGWAPCAIGLMMPVFVLLLTQEIGLITGGLLLFVFGLGHGVPVIPLCAVTNTVRGKLGNKYVKAGKLMQTIFGIIIIFIGFIMAIRFWGVNLW